MTKRVFAIIVLVLLTLVAAGCRGGGDEGGGGASGLEREQIENIVRDYLRRDPNVPEYEIVVDEVEGDWARVTATPAGSATEPEILYLKREIAGVAPTPAAEAPTVAANDQQLPPTQQPPVATQTTAETGWVVVLGPQTTFTAEELDQAGVPAGVRP